MTPVILFDIVNLSNVRVAVNLLSATEKRIFCNKSRFKESVAFLKIIKLPKWDEFNLL